MTETLDGRKSLTTDGDSLADARAIDQKNAFDFILHLQTLLKISRIFHPTNENILTQLKMLFGLIQSLFDEKENVRLKARDGSLFFNNMRLKFGFKNYAIYKAMLQEMTKREFDDLSLVPGLTEEELQRFITLMAKLEKKSVSLFEDLVKGMEDQDIRHIVIEKNPVVAEKPGKDRTTALIYFLSIFHLKDSFAKEKTNGKISISTTKRLMQSIFKNIVDNEPFVQGMTNLKNYDEYTLNHSVNVCMLSIGLGRRLGLDRHELIDLGISAFFHDFGKIDTPREILDKPAKLDDGERLIIEKHPHQGAEKLVRLKEFKSLPLKAINVALEHHIKEDLSGYPKYFRKQSTHLFSKIVKIADYFDALTTKRIYRQNIFSRNEALLLMMQQAPSEFHPLLLRLFVQMMGVYPVGTFVLLTSGEIGLVVETNSDPSLIMQPRVKLITDAAGNKIDGDTVDLAEKDPMSGGNPRRILKILIPDKYQLEASDYFIARAAS